MEAFCLQHSRVDTQTLTASWLTSSVSSTSALSPMLIFYVFWVSDITVGAFMADSVVLLRCVSLLEGVWLVS